MKRSGVWYIKSAQELSDVRYNNIQSCITWDMDKIIYTCSAEYIGYCFQKRRIWNRNKRQRQIQLEWMEPFSDAEVCICIQILENYSEVFQLHLPHAYREEIFTEFIRQACGREKAEVLLIVDEAAEFFCDLLEKQAEDMNYLAVLTKNPKEYEAVMKALEYEYGLYGMFFCDYRDFLQYQKQICDGKKTIVFKAQGDWTDDDGDKKKKIRFPQGSRVLDFDVGSSCQKLIREKRMQNDYASIANFLDNIVKNRYNSMVNEGLQNKMSQEPCLRKNVSCTDDKNKLGGKRKGIKKWKKRKIF